jgi:hypothetical protein
MIHFIKKTSKRTHTHTYIQTNVQINILQIYKNNINIHISSSCNVRCKKLLSKTQSNIYLFIMNAVYTALRYAMLGHQQANKTRININIFQSKTTHHPSNWIIRLLFYQMNKYVEKKENKLMSVIHRSKFICPSSHLSIYIYLSVNLSTYLSSIKRPTATKCPNYIIPKKKKDFVNVINTRTTQPATTEQARSNITTIPLYLITIVYIISPTSATSSSK